MWSRKTDPTPGCRGAGIATTAGRMSVGVDEGVGWRRGGMGNQGSRRRNQALSWRLARDATAARVHRHGVGWRRGGTSDQESASSDSGRRGGGLQQRLTPTLMATGAPAPAPTRPQWTTSSGHPSSSSSPPKSSAGVAEREEAPCTQAPWPRGSLVANRSEQRTRGGEGRVGEGQPRRRRAKLDVATLDASVAGRGGEGRQEAA